LIGVLAMGIGLFMAIMDVQIVTSSLTQIQAGLSASTDEIAWVQTAYLIADVVMVPMCATMSRLLPSAISSLPTLLPIRCICHERWRQLLGFGRRVIAGGGKIDLLEGGSMPEGISLIEFPTADAARGWYRSVTIRRR
jgi:MFS family permease